MDRTPTMTARGASEADLLARLGLRAGASDDEVEAAHDEIIEFLQAAPGSLRDWAHGRLDEVDEAYAQLNGGKAPVAASPSGPSAAKAAARVRRAPAGIDGDDVDTWDDELDAPAVVTHRAARRARQPEAATAPGQPGMVTISRRSLFRFGFGGAVVVALAVAAFVIYQAGAATVPGITGTPAPSASGLDLAAVSADMQKLQANPNDTATLQDLANQYFDTGDYATAQTWLTKILAIDPKNEAALLGSGAVAYNLGDNTTAEKDWRAVLAIDPKDVEAHYDLGFMYFSETPPNIPGVQTEWNAVLQYSTDTDLNSYVQTHLDSLASLESGAPASGAPASPASGASPAPSASPAPTPAAS